MIKTAQDAYLAGRQAALEKISNAGLIRGLVLPVTAGLGVGAAYGLYKNRKGKNKTPLSKRDQMAAGLLGGGTYPRTKMEKKAQSSEDMRRYLLANLDAGTTPLQTVGTGVAASLLGGGLAASTGPGGLKSRIGRGLLGALPGAALGAYLEDNRQAAYDDLYNMTDQELKDSYTRNKSVNDSFGFDPFHEVSSRGY